MDATLRIVARDGVSAVTHRRVAAEAGVSNGLTTYHFSSKHEMLVAAYEHWIATAIERVRTTALARSQRNAAPSMASMIDVLVEVTASELEAPDAGAEFALAQEPALSGDFGRWEKTLLALIKSACEGIGTREPGQDAWILLSAIRGLQLAHLAGGGRPPNRRSLRRTFSRLVEALAR
jgi:AcrR family transcriptional regulator